MSGGSSSGAVQEELDNVYCVLDPQLHPVTPDTSCQESVQIFEQHKQLAQEFLKVQTEIAYLSRYMCQLAERLSEEEGMSQLDQQDSERHQEELRKLEVEKASLMALKQNLQRQLELLRGQQRHNGQAGSSSGHSVPANGGGGGGGGGRCSRGNNSGPANTSGTMGGGGSSGGGGTSANSRSNSGNGRTNTVDEGWVILPSRG